MENERKWLALLAEGELSSKYVNVENVRAIADINRYDVLDYVLRTLEVFDRKYASVCPFPEMVRTALKWSETAKGGNAKTRKKWMEMGYDLAVHNAGSAQIYLEYCDSAGTPRSADQPVSAGQSDSITQSGSVCPACAGYSDYDKCVAAMISVHGTVGQYIRGEIGRQDMDDLKRCAELLFDYVFQNAQEEGPVGQADSWKRVYFMLSALTKSVIGGVSDALLRGTEGEIEGILKSVVGGSDALYMSGDERIKRIKPDFSIPAQEYCEKYPDLAEQLGGYSLWYPQIAMESMSDQIFLKILNEAVKRAGERGRCRNINFKKISDFLYYDYQGKKHINVYKMRILESLKYAGGVNENKHIKMTFEFALNDTVLYVGYELSPVCERLVDFCVEAERSGDISYEKAIVLLFDFFNFRKDSFDRLNNENVYLDSMNDISGSRKGEIIDYVVGEKVADVGSGSGVLLSLLEQKFPEKQVIGTDISQEVIDRLRSRAAKEGRGWQVLRHNFVEGPLEEKVDSVIFSSILHEIYSFTESDGRKFHKESVARALKHACESLNPGGRIIIRDGVKTSSIYDSELHIKEPSGKDFFLNFLKDFKGLPEYDRSKIIYQDVFDSNEEFLYFKVVADVNYIREFMYTYTWGTSSYPQEVQEQFGYYTLKDFEDAARALGAKLIHLESYVEPDYYKYLGNLVSYGRYNGKYNGRYNGDPHNGHERSSESGFEEAPYPHSNCIVVMQKD